MSLDQISLKGEDALLQYEEEEKVEFIETKKIRIQELSQFNSSLSIKVHL